MQEQKLLKSSEAARMLCVSKMTLNRWIKNGIITPAKVVKNKYQNYNYFTKEQIDEFKKCDIQKQSVTSKCNIQSVTSKCDIVNKSATSEKKHESQNKGKVVKEVHEPNGDVIRLIEYDDDDDEIQEQDLHEDLPPIETQKVSINVPKNKKLPNDKLRKTTFNFMPEEYKPPKKVTLEVKEKTLTHKKKGFVSSIDVLTKVNIFYPEKAILDCPRLTPFDGEVLDACISLQAANIRFTTTDAIYRMMIGSSDKRKQPSSRMDLFIKYSLDKLLFCKVKIDLSEICKRLGYNNGEPVILHNSFIPGNYVEHVEANGKITTIVEFYEPSPLFKIAEIKNGQILSYPANLLDAPVYNTPDIIVIKNYMIRRIWESITHKQMRNIMTFDDIFEKAELFNLSKNQRSRFYEYIKAILDFWVNKKFLLSYKIIKKNRTFYSIHFVPTTNISDLFDDEETSSVAIVT